MADKSLARKKITPVPLPEQPEDNSGTPSGARAKLVAVGVAVLAALALTAGGVTIGDVTIGDVNVGVQSPLEVPTK